MKPLLCVVLPLLACNGLTAASPSVVDHRSDLTYQGANRNGIEVFLNIPYGQDTGGENRFKPPRPYAPKHGSIIHADSYGPACPQNTTSQDTGEKLTISEDCLSLNIARPKPSCKAERLPVMVFIHGGGFWSGSNADSLYQPDTLVAESVQNGLPIIHVGINYRLGVFGFAQSDALMSERSENAGVRDQRLALEWVRENIALFGGDPNKITVFGQSSGGLSVGIQMMAYGASKPVPFHQGICMSQALEPGITGSFTLDAMKAVVDQIGCDKADFNDEATVACLRNHDMTSVLDASLATYREDLNLGDIWLPVVDGDFLPAAPSQLIKEGRFASVATAIGWCQNDMAFGLDPTIETATDTHSYIQHYIPTVGSGNVEKLLSLYPSDDFAANETAGLSREFFRTARVIRDIIMTCQPIYYAEHMDSTVRLYDWNQTVLDVIFPGYGVVHGSDLAYVYGNLSSYNIGATQSDLALSQKAARSWSTFASTGKFGLEDHDTFQNFSPAFTVNDNIQVFVAGGAMEGLSTIDGPGATAAMSSQRLRERCAFINSPEMIKELRY